MKLRKFIALLTATVMTSTAGSSLVLAESYQETEKANIANFASTVAEALQKAETVCESESVHAYADLCLSLGDTGRTLLSMMSPIDITWLDNIEFHCSVSSNAAIEYIVGDLCLNNTSVCSLECYMDLENMCFYMRIPELNDSYLVMNISYTLYNEFTAIYKILKNYMYDPSALLPEASAMEDLLNRYGAILADGFIETNPYEDTISIEDISMDCLSLEGQIQAEDMQRLLTNVLTTAKEDVQLKEIIEIWAPVFQVNSFEIYQEFQAFINETLASFEEEPFENDGSSLSSTIWQDTDGNIVGRQFILRNDTEEIPFFTYKAPVSNSDKGFYLDIRDDGESFSISGKGTVSNDKLNGSYDLLYDDIVMASVELIDTDTKAAEDGSSSGSYKFTLQPGIGEKEYQYLSGFAILADVSNYGDSAGSEFNLSLTKSEDAWVSLSLNAGRSDAMENPDDTAFSDVLDCIHMIQYFFLIPGYRPFLNILNVDSSYDMDTYLSKMDWQPILENCITAGMTEKAATQINDLIYESFYE